MASRAVINSSQFISGTEASKLFGYTRQYLIFLSKSGKVEGKKMGTRWYFSTTSLEKFFNENNEHKKERLQKLSEERKKEYRATSTPKEEPSPALNPAYYKKGILLEAVVVFILVVSLGFAGYSGITREEALVFGSDRGGGFFSALAISVYEFFSPRPISQITSQKNDNDVYIPSEGTGVNSNIKSITHTSLVVAPDEIFTATTVESVREFFSDEVEISVDVDHPDSGTIVPIFEDREGTSYRFLMVPVHNPSTQ